MTRKKVKLDWIEGESARKSSFRKRRQGLLKKVRELCILCGVNGFAIIYGPGSEQPAIWPSCFAVQQMIYKFRNIPDMDRCRKMVTQESYLRERVAKVQDQVKKQTKKNRDLEMSNLMYQLDQGTKLSELQTSELIKLYSLIEEKMKETRKRIAYFENVALPLEPFPFEEDLVGDDDEDYEEDDDDPMMDLTGVRGGAEERSLMDQWFIDMMMNNHKDMNFGSSSSSIRGETGLPVPAAHFYGGGPPEFSSNGKGTSFPFYGDVNGTNFSGTEMGFSNNFIRDENGMMGFANFENFGDMRGEFTDLGLPQPEYNGWEQMMNQFGNMGSGFTNNGMYFQYSDQQIGNNYNSNNNNGGNDDQVRGLMPPPAPAPAPAVGTEIENDMFAAASDAALSFDFNNVWATIFSSP